MLRFLRRFPPNRFGETRPFPRENQSSNGASSVNAGRGVGRRNCVGGPLHDSRDATKHRVSHDLSPRHGPVSTRRNIKSRMSATCFPATVVARSVNVAGPGRRCITPNFIGRQSLTYPSARSNRSCSIPLSGTSLATSIRAAIRSSPRLSSISRTDAVAAAGVVHFDFAVSFA